MRSFFSFQSHKCLTLQWRWALNTGKQNHSLNGLSQRWNKTDKIPSWWITPLLLANVFWFIPNNLLSLCFVSLLSTNPLQIQEKNMNWILVYMSFASEESRFQCPPHGEGRHRCGMELVTSVISNTFPNTDLRDRIHSPICNQWVGGERPLRIKSSETNSAKYSETNQCFDKLQN